MELYNNGNAREVEKTSIFKKRQVDENDDSESGVTNFADLLPIKTNYIPCKPTLSGKFLSVHYPP